MKNVVEWGPYDQPIPRRCGSAPGRALILRKYRERTNWLSQDDGSAVVAGGVPAVGSLLLTFADVAAVENYRRRSRSRHGHRARSATKSMACIRARGLCEPRLIR